MLERNIAIEGILNNYIRNNIDIMCHCVQEWVDFGKGLEPPEAMSSMPVQSPNGSIKSVGIIPLRFRMKFRNTPYIENDTLICTLSFNNNWRLVKVPFDAIAAINPDQYPNFVISIPVNVDLFNTQPTKDDPIKPQDKKPQDKKLNRGHLKIVK